MPPPITIRPRDRDEDDDGRSSSRTAPRTRPEETLRRQDEIRLIFPSQHPENQVFLLSELDRFSHAFDAEEILDLILAQAGNAVADVRQQALATTTLFLPGYVARRHGSATEHGGVWSDLHSERRLAAPLAEEVAMVRERQEIRRAAVACLEPLFKRMAKALDGLSPRAAFNALTALALLPNGYDHVSKWMATRRPPFGVVWAWASGGGATQDPDRLITLLDREGVDRPELLRAALWLPPAGVAELVGRLEGRLDWRGTAHLAVAVGRAGGVEGLALLERLSTDATGWGEIYVLRALEALGLTEGFDLLRRIHARTRHEFVRLQALRAAGGLPHQQAMDFCVAQLDTVGAPTAAQALESLVRMRCDRAYLAQKARRFVDSDHLRVRVNALLASTTAREGVYPESFVALLRHVDPFARTAAGFCLAYWRNRTSIELLSRLASADPHALVRSQAIKSLSKYPARWSIPLLTRIVETSEPAEALIAARVMARLGGEGVQGLVRFFTKELARNAEGFRRALLLKALGGLAVRGRPEGVEKVFETALAIDQPSVTAAALDGWRLLGGPTTADAGARLKQLATGPDQALAASASVVSFLAGDLGVVERLGTALGSADENLVAPATQAVLDLVLLCTRVVGAEHRALVSALPPPPEHSVQVPIWAVERRVSTSLEEGEFDPGAEPATQPPGGKPESGPIATPAPPAAGAVDVRALLAQIDGKGGPEGPSKQDLSQETYLVTADEIDVLSRELPKDRLLRTIRRSSAFLRMNPVLILPPAAVLLILFVIMIGTVPPTQKVATRSPPALTIMSVAGSAAIAGDPAPLGVGDVVRVGESIQLADGAQARLVTAAGDEVNLLQAAELEVLGVGEAEGLSARLLRGVVACSFSANQAMTLRFGMRAVTGRGVRLQVQAAGDRWVLWPASSNVEVVDPDGTRRALQPGSKVELR